PAIYTLSLHDALPILPMTNSGIHAGTADLYAWGIHDAPEGGVPMDVRDVGVQVQPGAAFGVPDSDRGLVFLINTYGQATNQSVKDRKSTRLNSSHRTI